jgi:tRNA pseudouridine55 synthase
MDGIICVNKPSGWTSFDIVAKVRGMARTKKVGHAGTLDPMATGVLPLFLGVATKVCDIMPNDQKGYIAEFRLGVQTDTLDITGEIQEQTDSHITLEQLSSVLSHYRGEIEQIPPMYSAIQINGQRLYDLARAGQKVKRKPRSVTIHRLELLSFSPESQTAKIEVICSKGTYIRSLCSDIGEELGVGAVLTSLVRHIAGDFTLDDCYSLEQLQQLTDEGQLSQVLMPVERVFETYPDIRLNEVQSKKFLNGLRLDLNRVIYQNKTGFHRVFNQDHVFLGLASLDLERMELVIEKMFQRN